MVEPYENPKFRVTETQQLIANAALRASNGTITLHDPQVEDLVRMLVVIQKSGLGSYFANGLDWSFRSRHLHEPDQVAAEQTALTDAVNRLTETIDTARGKAASRIRWNRTRRLRHYERELEEDIRERQENLMALQEHRAAIRQAARMEDANNDPRVAA